MTIWICFITKSVLYEDLVANWPNRLFHLALSLAEHTLLAHIVASLLLIFRGRRMFEAMPVTIAGKLLLLIQAAPSCKCGGKCETLQFFTKELDRLVREADWVEETR